jgi:hypothetical protein
MAGDNPVSDKWRFAIADPSQLRDPQIQKVVDEGMDAVPQGFLGEDVVELLPKNPLGGRCRICGRVAQLTKEHIPPRNSGNKQRYSSHSFDEWIERNSLEIPDAGRIHQGGIYGYTLCSTCNSLTGARYGGEYKTWVAATMGAMSAMPGPEILNDRVEPLGWQLQLGNNTTGGVKPGAFVRQVLSMMCTLSGSWNLAECHPEVRRIILKSSLEPLANNLALGAALYYGPRIRIMGPTMKVEPTTRSWRWLMEMAYPPFAFLMILDSNLDDPGTGLMMTDWVQYEPSAEMQFEGLFEVGFGWTPYPGDYRSRTCAEAESGNVA